MANQRHTFVYLDGLLPIEVLRNRQAKVNALRERWLSSPECSVRGVSKPQFPALRYGDAAQSASGEELRPLFGRTLMTSILEKAFKGEL